MPISGVLSCRAASSSAASCDFHQHGHAEFVGQRFQLFHLRQLQRRHDQQDGVGADGAGAADLVGVDHEVLAQHRDVAGGARFDQVVLAALEELHVGQHRQAGGAMGFIAPGNGGGIEVLPDYASGGTGLLDLGDYRRLARGDLGADGTDEIARLRHRLGFGTHGGIGLLRHGAGDFGLFDFEDFLQDVGHVCFHRGDAEARRSV